MVRILRMSEDSTKGGSKGVEEIRRSLFHAHYRPVIITIIYLYIFICLYEYICICLYSYISNYYLQYGPALRRAFPTPCFRPNPLPGFSLFFKAGRAGTLSPPGSGRVESIESMAGNSQELFILGKLPCR